jgi:DNA-binding CsgD family transcriptional regulator
MPDREEPGQVHLGNQCVLSDREAQVVRLLVSGHAVPTIGKLLFLTPSTIRNHLGSVYRKLRVNGQEELVLTFFAMWREERTPASEVLRRLCAACRTPWWC